MLRLTNSLFFNAAAKPEIMVMRIFFSNYLLAYFLLSFADNISVRFCACRFWTFRCVFTRAESFCACRFFLHVPILFCAAAADTISVTQIFPSCHFNSFLCVHFVDAAAADDISVI